MAPRDACEAPHNFTWCLSPTTGSLSWGGPPWQPQATQSTGPPRQIDHYGRQVDLSARLLARKRLARKEKCWRRRGGGGSRMSSSGRMERQRGSSSVSYVIIKGGGVASVPLAYSNLLVLLSVAHTSGCGRCGLATDCHGLPWAWPAWGHVDHLLDPVPPAPEPRVLCT